MITTIGAVLVVGAAVLVSAQNATAAGPLYLNPHASPQARAADLVRRMTLPEQIGQMVQIQVGHLYGDCTGYNPGQLNPTCEQQVLVTDGAGSILSGGGDVPGEGALPNTPQTWAEQINAIEKYSIDHSRLHIPIIYGADIVHGHSDVVNATLFPHQIGFGATFDPQLVEAAQSAASKASAATNVRWAFAPVADVVTDSRWGRYYESFGEDTLLDGTMGAAAVTGLQSSGIVTASVKHFAGYGAADSGLDRTPTDLSMRNLETNQLPSYAQAIGAGALTVMINSGSVNGVPVTGSHYMVTDVLRNQIGFTGVAISDWRDVAALADTYHVAPDYEHAIALAVNAGVDETMEPHDADGFTSNLTKAVQDGLVSKKRVAQAAQRILELKFKLGLFDHPYVDASQANAKVLGADLPLARKAAAESSVLLRNQNNVLPFSPSSKLVVTGPSADSVPSILGGWSVGWQGVPAGSAEDAVTVREGLQEAGGSNVTYAPDQASAVSALGSADAAVVVLGRGPGAEGPNDQRDPTLPADQQALVTALKATGKPVVVVLIDDRPEALGAAKTADGLLMAWRPGTEGGHGVSDVLYGAVNPSARLPVSWPKNGSDQPNSYRLANIHTTGAGYDPQYPFGAGLSYTTYTSAVSAVSSGSHRSVDVKVDVANTGSKAGDLVVPVYTTQPTSLVLVPVKRLVGFTRVHLDAGQSKSVTVNVQSSALGVVPGDVNASGPLVVEHGSYVFSTGTAAGTPTSSASNTITL
ncbi:MAG TPA: glycoside hydrolase family 3 N-terminal domain-containing protein [Jatrophihabitantaceae bacterium]